MIKTSGAQESDCYSGKLLDGSFSDDYATIPVHAGDTLPLFFLRYKLVKCTFFFKEKVTDQTFSGSYEFFATLCLDTD